MADKTPFRVVIIGGSVAGLVLGNMLQLNGIDFIILEAYPAIAPQVGASIGLLPNGNRILDQLGLFDTILGLAPPVERFNFRNSKGERIAGHSGMRHSFEQRHGYPILFLDRQAVLQVLYDNIKDKSKVLTEKRLAKIDMNENGVKAIMTDGSEFTGDILVGGDGIHSKTRSEMWRLAEEKIPGYIPVGEDNAPPCDYSCIFGISNPVPGLEPGNLHSVFREQNSYLINGGPEGRVYWFYFFKHPSTLYGSAIPRYTKADEAAVLKAHENDPITPEITFKVLQERKISSTLTALPEYVYKKWFFERIVTIGDSVHKFNPIGGHGGNTAFETSAAFVNSLVKLLKTSSRPSTSEITKLFADLQALRETRATILKDASHEQQRTEAMEDRLHKFIALTLLPITDTEDVMFNFSGNQPYADKLDMVELPPRAKLIPYKDELARAPELRGVVGWLQMACYMALAVFAYYGMWVRSKNAGLAEEFASILRSPRLAAEKDEKLGPLSMYFFGMLIQPLSIWLVEGCRKRNDMNLVAVPTIWLALSQYLGFGIIAPIFYTAYTLFSNAEPYWWPLSRLVPAHYMKVILPCILFCYALPTLLLFLPSQSQSLPLTLTLDSLFRYTPILTSLLTLLTSTILKKLIPPPTATPTASHTPADIPHLRTLYLTTFILGLLLHITILAQILFSNNPILSLPSIFLPNTPITNTSTPNLHSYFLVEFWSFYLATYIWCCNAVWDIKRVGRTTVDVGKAAVLLLLANVAVGPGAALVGCWYWREAQMARTSVSAKK
ncbi:hypothetical protein BCIN_01g09920 [Botrytis cinerea B05.10]|uniref:FAD-binding domain-containing protein n=2 Tax=Botryotinia fuckeliana TaxID=40559 RepID=A0A384J701_BOTFB|nr:hypothetical protein BCIN_01g09920 [Botrytis cinerea B05.10]ATZ46386.1 hypothetical protein BCIN_01g09920 [Botrytis cinerea B05.10]EMR81426.1 putative fad binding domain-containing protein [Botrytis cinerea BcDW1]